LLTTALPTFWVGMILLLIFGVYFRAFPLAGAISRPPPPDFWSQILDRLWHLTLPGLTLFLFFYGTFALLARSAVLETLTEDYILTARAKGLSNRSILFKHALRNALLPIVTTAAIWLASVIGGAIITEQIFTYEGMGYLIWMAVLRYDYPVLQACFYIFALAVILANFVADVIYSFIDPRIKY
ncbi:MAG: ABC transporter permease, partial [Thermoprotei archaeon]